MWKNYLTRKEIYQQNHYISENEFYPVLYMEGSSGYGSLKERVLGEKNTRKLFKVIGDNFEFVGPFGPRKCLYLDYTASGRALEQIEDIMTTKVLPIYANTHSTTSHFASQITNLRDESRNLIMSQCGANVEEDVLIFCGAGSTAAIHKLANSLLTPNEETPVVIIGPFEHHSNILLWRELTKDVIMISQDSNGLLNLKHLEKTLKSLKESGTFERRLVLGSFSAGSNVTGVLTDDVAVTILLHRFGAYAIWDFAAAGPHVKIDMNPRTGLGIEVDRLAAKDGIVFSGHKFIGGPATPGVLIAKKNVFRNPVPDGHGGGTVQFVTSESHQYLKEIVERNEGGTPDILGSIRLGTVFHVQNSIVGIDFIMETEAEYTRLVLNAWGKIPEIKILGPTSVPRLPIISFMIKHPQTGLYLHHDFLIAIFNDLFGIQIRGGCMCAGPYGMTLLQINKNLEKKYANIIVDLPIFKPGFARMSLPYHASKAEINFAIQAVEIVAKHGWKLLPFYKIEGANFRFALRRKNAVKNFGLTDLFESDKSESLDSEAYSPNFKECLQFARELIKTAENALSESKEFISSSISYGKDAEPFRWFLTPFEAGLCAKTTKLQKRKSSPFSPRQNYKLKKSSSIWMDGSIPANFPNTSKLLSQSVLDLML